MALEPALLADQPWRGEDARAGCFLHCLPLPLRTARPGTLNLSASGGPQTCGPENSSFLAHLLGPVSRGIFLESRYGHAPSEIFTETFSGIPLAPLYIGSSPPHRRPPRISRQFPCAAPPAAWSTSASVLSLCPPVSRHPVPRGPLPIAVLPLLSVSSWETCFPVWLGCPSPCWWHRVCSTIRLTLHFLSPVHVGSTGRGDLSAGCSGLRVVPLFCIWIYIYLFNNTLLQ